MNSNNSVTTNNQNTNNNANININHQVLSSFLGASSAAVTCQAQPNLFSTFNKEIISSSQDNRKCKMILIDVIFHYLIFINIRTGTRDLF